VYDRRTLWRWQVQNYRKMVRPQLRGGELFFACGNYPLSMVIKKISKSIFSHVGIVFRLEQIDRVVVLESVENAGVRLIPLSRYLEDYAEGKSYDGRIYLAKFFKDLDPDQLRTMADRGTTRLASPYDMNELVTIMARIVLGSSIVKKQNAYVCSELVDDCFKAIKVGFKYNKHKFIAPDNIAKDRRVKFWCRLL
jgi:hypothetical protein